MESNRTISIPEDWMKQMKAQAEREYPRECCGVILGSFETPDRLYRLFPCRNAADEWHEQDPGAFPRTAAEAYWIDPRQLCAIQRIMRQTRSCLSLIYHSHPDQDSRFSEEDAERALFDGQPLYPGTLYGVFSVRKGKAVDWSVFGWDSVRQTYALQSSKIFKSFS